MPDRERDLRTRAVHAGTKLEGAAAQQVVPPVHVSAVGYFDSADDLDRSLDGQDFVYGRINSQNTALLEDAIAELESAEAAVSYSTGMAALKAVFEAQAFKQKDRVVIAADGYGASRALFKALAAERGVELHALKLDEPDAHLKLRELRPKLVLAESITNPLLAVPDVQQLAAACKKVGARLAVDATFASPVLQRPLELGADYSIQSTTKWINGHSDALGGTVAGAHALIEPLKKARILSGALLGPFEAWLTLRGLRTLPVRMRAHCEHARIVAERLSASSLFDRVIYPGAEDYPNRELSRAMLQGGLGGGLVSFEIKGADRRACFRFLESVRIAKPAPSLGDVSTFVMHAASASARRMTPEERQVAGIGENLIRVSVGLEDPEEIAHDLLQAVEQAVSVQ